MFLRSCAFAFSVFLATPLVAEVDQTQARALWQALGQPQVVEIMRQEGLIYGEGIAADMFPDRNAAAWSATVSEIYSADRMEATAFADFAKSIAGSDMDAIFAFLETDLGQQVIELEVAARRAMLEDAVDQAARDAAALALADDTPRQQQIAQFVSVNDLIESNVSAAMNANYAFYIGLLDGGAMPGEITTDQILTDVWDQEPDIRNSTGEWVFSFLTLAYQPLSDADMDAYIAFTDSKPGQDMNKALFAAYDQLFIDISRSLGVEAARAMQGADL